MDSLVTASFSSSPFPKMASLSDAADAAATGRTGSADFSTAPLNSSSSSSPREDCLQVVFSQMEFLPWDNPHNFLSAEAENAVRRIKNNLLALLFLIGGPANVINMAVFYKQGLKDRVNLCLFALSLVDGCYLAMAVLHHGEQLYIQFTTKEVFGPVSTFLTNQNLTVLLPPFCYISPVLSAIIATERCLCVFRPLRFQTLLRTRTMAVIILAVSVLVFGLFFIVTFRYRVGCVYDPVSGIVVTTGIEGEFYKNHKELIDSLESSVFGIGLPGVMMVVVTVATVLTIVKLRQIVTWRSETSSAISPREIALTKMLVGNSILFITCTFPNALNRFIWIFLPEVNLGRRNQNFFLAGIWTGEAFTYINATFNFAVYCAMGSHFRHTLGTLCCRKPRPKTKG